MKAIQVEQYTPKAIQENDNQIKRKQGRGRPRTDFVDVSHDDVGEEFLGVALALHHGHQRRGDVFLGLDADGRLQHLAHRHVVRFQVLGKKNTHTKRFITQNWSHVSKKSLCVRTWNV